MGVSNFFNINFSDFSVGTPCTFIIHRCCLVYLRSPTVGGWVFSQKNSSYNSRAAFRSCMTNRKKNERGRKWAKSKMKKVIESERETESQRENANISSGATYPSQPDTRLNRYAIRPCAFVQRLFMTGNLLQNGS